MLQTATRTTAAAQPPIGRLLKHWRAARRLSQLDLAMEAEVSARHVSFVETGRAKPSRDLLLRLADVLDVPMREQNTLLAAAGFAEHFRETELSAPELSAAQEAVQHILQAMNPHGAMLVDRHWNILQANPAVQAMFAQFLSPEVMAAQGAQPNAYRLVFHPEGFRKYIVNWHDMAHHFMQRLHREVMDGRNDPVLQALLEEMLSYPEVPEDWRTADLETPTGPMMSMHLQKDALELQLFTTITTFGTAQDVTLQELRIETFHPADAKTQQVLQAMA